MKVKELKKILAALPKDSEIYVQHEETYDDTSVFCEVDVKKVYLEESDDSVIIVTGLVVDWDNSDSWW